MNEQEVATKLEAYRQSIGVPHRVAMPRVRVISPRVRVWATAAGAALLLGGFVVWPAYANAEAIKRLGYAIKNARTMDSTIEIERPDGTWAKATRVLYDSGKWRYENRFTPQMARTLIYRDGLFIDDYAVLDHASQEPEGAWNGQPTAPENAVEVAQRLLGASLTKRHVESAPDVDGKSVYRLTLEDDHQSKLVLLVDRATDLPISSEMWSMDTNTAGNGVQHVRATYRFNESLPKSLFEFTAGRKLVDLTKSVQAWRKAHSKPIASVGNLRVLDATVTADGTIWFTIEGGDGLEIRNLKADDGIFSPLSEFHRDYPWAGKKASPSVVRAFTPILPLTKTPDWVQFQVVRSGTSRAIGRGSVPLRAEKSLVPAHLAELGFQHHLVAREHLVLRAQAKGLAVAGEALNAAQAFEHAATKAFVKYAGHLDLDEAAKLYRKMNRFADAERVETESARLKQTRER